MVFESCILWCGSLTLARYTLIGPLGERLGLILSLSLSRNRKFSAISHTAFTRGLSDASRLCVYCTVPFSCSMRLISSSLPQVDPFFQTFSWLPALCLRHSTQRRPLQTFNQSSTQLSKLTRSKRRETPRSSPRISATNVRLPWFDSCRASGPGG